MKGRPEGIAVGVQSLGKRHDDFHVRMNTEERMAEGPSCRGPVGRLWLVRRKIPKA